MCGPPGPKGLLEKMVIGKHALKNAMIPLVTVAGMQFGFLIGGTVIIETVFAWPGVGRLVVQAIFTRDYPLVQAAVLVLSVLFVLINLMTDLIYLYLDPQISFLEAEMNGSTERFRHLRASLRLWGETFQALGRSPGAVIGGILFSPSSPPASFSRSVYPRDPLAQDLMMRTHPAFLAGRRQPRLSPGHGQSGTRYPGADPLRQPGEPAGRVFLGAGGLRLRDRPGTDFRLLRRAGSTMSSCGWPMCSWPIPFMLLTISVIAVLGNSIFNLILVLGLSDWVTYARTIRGSVLSIKKKEFVLASRSVGTPHRVILMRQIFPNVLSPILVLATVRVANIIIWESGLSFLGMGVPPPMPTWGRMLAEGRVYIADAWWLVTLPGLAIMLTILSINLLGDGLRDALDPANLRNDGFPRY